MIDETRGECERERERKKEREKGWSREKLETVYCSVIVEVAER